MKRFEVWLTALIVFSLPALVFAQDTGGSTDRQGKVNATKTTGGKKVIHQEARRKGAPKTPQTTGSGNTPQLEAQAGTVHEDGTGSKGLHKGGQATTTAKKKPPRPAPEKQPDKQ